MKQQNKNEIRKMLDEEVSSWLKSNKITKGKTIRKSRTFKKAYTGRLLPCPECNSKLIVDISGVIICSQDKLSDIYKQCLEYHNGDEKTKLEILKKDKGQFQNFYDRWKHKDANGKRTEFQCTYSNRLHSPVPSYNFYIKDIFQIKRLEKIIKRPLSKAELEGIVKVKYQNSKGNIIEEYVTRIRFPYDLI